MQKLLSHVLLIGLVGVLIPVMGLAQVSASSSATTSGPVRATVGTFVFPQGSAIAVELTRTTPCSCMCGPILVQKLTVRNNAGASVYAADIGATDSARWIGLWNLQNDAGTPVPPGVYTVIVATSIGEFRATVKVVPTTATSTYGRMTAHASVCGIGLAVYRAVTEADAGTAIDLHSGDKVLIILPGNPTTGYRWTPLSAPTPSIMKPLPGPDYQPGTSTAVGAGGRFLFRYVTVGPGTAVLKFAYRRSWETTPPEKSFTITIIVR